MQDHMVLLGQHSGPTRLHHGCGIGFPDQRRPLDAIAGQQFGAPEYRRGVRSTPAPHLHHVDRHRRPRGALPQACLNNGLPLSHRLHANRLRHQRTARCGKAESRTVSRGKRLGHRLHTIEFHLQRRLGAGVAQMQPPPQRAGGGVSPLRR